MIKRIIIIFILALVLNFIWENFHSQLYVHYQRGLITQLVLLKAAVVDASFITILATFFLKVGYLKGRQWYLLTIGIIAAILLEKYALITNRWAYNNSMPVIPIIKTGLTPTIQLGLLSYLIFKIVFKNNGQ